jgi:hypothetical protein
LRDNINRVENLFNAGKNAFNQVGAAFDDLSRDIQSFPGKVNGVKNEVGKLVGTIGDKVEGFLEEVYGKLFPTDAGSMVNDIACRQRRLWEKVATDRILKIHPRSVVSFEDSIKTFSEMIFAAFCITITPHNLAPHINAQPSSAAQPCPQIQPTGKRRNLDVLPSKV